MKACATYLVQTDTTAGFLSQDLSAVNTLKGRERTQPCLRTVSSCKTLKDFARVPKKYRRYVRKAKHTTFLFSNGEACRVVSGGAHHLFLKRYFWMYSTSANPTGKGFDHTYAFQKADIIVEDNEGFYEARSSSFIKLGRKSQRRLR